MNKSLLYDAVICENAEEEVKNYFLLNKNCGVSLEMVWDGFKAVIWGHFISVATSCKRTKSLIINELKAKIAFLEAKHIWCVCSYNLYRTVLYYSKFKI